ncbi:MAG: hypothetical protein V4726_21075 [Verrucomicrobiota bacterium]
MNRPADPSPVPVPASSRVRRRHRLHAGAGILVLALAPLALRGMLIENGLNVQTLSSNPNAVYSYSAAVGDGNHAAGVNSLAIGAGNHTIGGNSFTAGAGNTVSGANAVAVGQGNSVAGEQGNFVAGMGNIVNGWSNGAIGNGNKIYANGVGGFQSLAWGVGNQIEAGVKNATAGGHYNIVHANYGHAIGTALVNNSYGSVVLGWYNKPFGDEGTASRGGWRDLDPILVVGNGEDGVRSNALVVTKEGMTHIEVPPKGGIGMGAYTSR